MSGLVDWLNAEIGKQKLSGRVHESQIREDGNWFYVPVYVNVSDAYEKAKILQRIEDEWERDPVVPGRNLLLIPAAN